MNPTDAAARAGRTGLAALAAFGATALVMAGGDGAPLPGDRALLDWSVAHRPPAALAVARALTDTATGALPYVLALLAALVIGRTTRQRLLAAVCCPAYLGAGQAARYGLMTLLARPRPPHRAWATHASGWAFPSGHTTTATLTAELLLLAIMLRVRRGRTPLAVLVCCWAGLVGLTRVHLGVHWPSDVIGGWLFALGWLGPWAWGTALYLRRSTPIRPTRSSAPTAPQPPPEGT